MLRQISRNLAGLKRPEEERRKIRRQEDAVEGVLSALLEKEDTEDFKLKERQWYAGVNLNHANAAIVRANLSGNRNIKQLLIYNYEDAIRWDPPKYIRSRNNRIPVHLASKHKEDRAFGEVKELSRLVDDEIDQRSGRMSSRYQRMTVMRSGRESPELPPTMKVTKKMKLEATKTFAGLRMELGVGQRRGTMKMPPIPSSRVIFEIEVKNLPETVAGVLYPSPHGGMSRQHSENLSAYSRSSHFYNLQHGGPFMDLHPTEMGIIDEEHGFRGRRDDGEEELQTFERSQIMEEGAEDDARFADLMAVKRSFMSSGTFNKLGKDLARRKEQERDQLRQVAVEQEQRAINQEDFDDFIDYFPPITEKQVPMLMEDDAILPNAPKSGKKQKGGAQKASTGKRAVAAYEKGSDDFGEINFYGIVHKRRGKTVKFHTRWMVLRGIDLFWYRSASDHE